VRWRPGHSWRWFFRAETHVFIQLHSVRRFRCHFNLVPAPGAYPALRENYEPVRCGLHDLQLADIRRTKAPVHINPRGGVAVDRLRSRFLEMLGIKPTQKLIIPGFASLHQFSVLFGSGCIWKSCIKVCISCEISFSLWRVYAGAFGVYTRNMG
jgi:hypothetical protein